jgi:arsenite-transporting ATPase
VSLWEFLVRIIFFAGKGGVGKTSVAAATGIRAAGMGHRTVIMSLDVAHSLSDIFDLEKNLLDQNKGRPFKVKENLWIQELDISEEMEQNWGVIHKYFSNLIGRTGLDEIIAEELAILPGMEEISLLLYINRYAREKEFDVIILDCAPTGESLRFISIPPTLEWYIKKIFKIQRTIAKCVRPVAERISDVPLPGDDYFDAIEYLFRRLEGVEQILVDRETTSVRLVTNPEKIVLKETQRAFMYFCLYKMNIDAIIMNRILPDDVKDTYFAACKESQKKYIELAKEYFAPTPAFYVNLFKDEILGYDSLKLLADQIYGEKNPLERFFEGEPFTLVKKKGEYLLVIKLPFITKGSVQLNKLPDELIVRIGSMRRHMPLPRQVAASKEVSATLEGQCLFVHFRGGPQGKEKHKGEMAA